MFQENQIPVAASEIKARHVNYDTHSDSPKGICEDTEETQSPGIDRDLQEEDTAEIHRESQEEVTKGLIWYVVNTEIGQKALDGSHIGVHEVKRSHQDCERSLETWRTESPHITVTLPRDALRFVQKDDARDGNSSFDVRRGTATGAESVRPAKVAQADGACIARSTESEESDVPPRELTSKEDCLVAGTNQVSNASQIVSSAPMQAALDDPLTAKNDEIFDQQVIRPRASNPCLTYGSKRIVITPDTARLGRVESPGMGMVGIDQVSCPGSEPSPIIARPIIGNRFASGDAETTSGARGVMEERRRYIDIRDVLAVPRTVIRTFGSSLSSSDVDLEMQGANSIDTASESSVSSFDVADIGVGGGDQDSHSTTSGSVSAVVDPSRQRVRRSGHRQRGMTTYEKSRLALVILVATANIVFLWRMGEWEMENGLVNSRAQRTGRRVARLMLV